MIIKRIVNGMEREFRLTYLELRQAFEEEQHNIDLEDIRSIFDDMDNEELVEQYGMNRDAIEALIDSMAYRYRKYCNNDEHWMYDRDEAIQYIIASAKKDAIETVK